ncbi:MULTISPECIES: hypothetical protein [unclassified Idiomarina]|uniref:hypothetical protein n=1 Tax=unclassified Idiomarina TaxID=2614829 RepID=UPI00258052B4|nr:MULTISPECIES: hypothetical protein [unclassified Idiomarina]
MIEIKYVIPFLTLFLGGLIGNRLAIGRDKRKEYNAVVLPLKQKVLTYIDQLKVSKHISFGETEIKSLRGIVSERKYKIIQNLYNEYAGLVRTHQKVTEDGYIVYSAQGNKEISDKLKEINLMLSLK